MWHRGVDCSIGFDHWPFGIGIVGLVLSLVIVATLVLLLCKLVRSWTTASRKSRDARDTLAILESRLANGTITLQEYQNIRKILAR